MSGRNELRFGRKGSVAVQLVGDKAGLWFDHEANRGGRIDGIATERPSSEPRSWRFLDDDDRRETIDGILARASDPAGTVVETYLRSRGIDRWPHSVRFCRAPHGMLATAQRADGGILAVQVTYLDREGHKIEQHGATRRTKKRGENWATFAAVRMPGRGEPIACEGVETGLSCWIATGRPVFACLGIGNIARFRWPGKRGLTIASDGDEPGSPAHKLVFGDPEKDRSGIVAELRRERRVRVAYDQGRDANDILQAGGVDAVRDYLDQAR